MHHQTHRPTATPASIRATRRADHAACAALTPVEALAEYDRRFAAEIARTTPGFVAILTGDTPARYAALTLTATAPAPRLDAARNRARIQAGEGFPAGLDARGERILIAEAA